MIESTEQVLRKKGIDIPVFPTDSRRYKYWVVRWDESGNMVSFKESDTTYNSYELAHEEALKEALELELC